MATTTENPFPSTSTVGSGAIGGGLTGSGLSGSSAATTAPVTSPGATRAPSDMLDRVVQGAHDTIDRLAETAAPHVQRLEQGVQTASDTLTTRADQAREVSDEWTETLRSTVREHPLAALATALAVGVLFARITS